MPTKQITNPQGAFGYDPSENASLAQTVSYFEAGATVTAGDVVSLEELTASTDTALVHPSDTGTDDPANVAGVAVNGAATGEIVEVVTHGLAIVNVGTGTVAFEELATASSTAGEADGVTADGTTVVGDVFGYFLSADEVPAATQAYVWVDRV